jgi:predicted CXXCH cytochrome family protein
MAFIIRQVSRTSDGREIVRPATFEATSISVGRDAACEIHLADLAVELNHARITEQGNRRLLIEATSGLDFKVDGRSSMRSEIDAGRGAELRFGGHRLTISSDGTNPLITVERVEALSDSSEARDETGLFTLQKVAIGRRPMAWAFIAAVLALFLAWPIYTYATSAGVKDRAAGFHGDNSWVSGPLSDAHKSLENNCQACHTEKFVAAKDESCMVCHKDDAHDHADQAKLAMAKAAPDFGGRVKGWFKAAFNKKDGRCVDCHTEHEGAGPMAATPQAFCADCHATLKERVTDTKLGNAADFGTDHPEFMPLVTVGIQGDKRFAKRISFAEKPTENNGLKFTHAQHMSGNNAIGRMVQTMAQEQGWGSQLVCKDCHVATADQTRFQPITMEKNCQMCHSLAFDYIGGTMRTLRHGEPGMVVADLRAFYRSTGPVRPISLDGMSRRRPGNYAFAETAQDYVIGARAWPGRAEDAIRAVFSKGGACYDCHVVLPVPSQGAPVTIQKVFQPDRYMNHGWFDHDAHKSETCVSCHRADLSNNATDLLLPDMASCRTCHVGGTGNALKPVKTPVNSTCAVCHDYHFDTMAPWKTKLEVEKGKGRPRFTAKAGAG